MIVFEDIHYIAYFIVEDIPQKEIDDFLYDVCKGLNSDIEWRTDLYSDKIHHEAIKKALESQFTKQIKRESYTCISKRNDISPYDFRPVSSFSKDEVLNLMACASNSTLDKMLQRNYKSFGLSLCMHNEYTRLCMLEGSEIFFQILFVNDVMVGFISLERLLNEIGGISYIGVKPEYQGHYYSSILLQKAQDMAYEHGILKLIGDIDIHNHAIRYNLLQTGFIKDCEQIVFKKEKIL